MAEVTENTCKSLIAKWERIAQGDLFADDFNESLLVNKGLHAFQELTDLKLTEASYRAQIVLLNASLVHQFEGACFNLGQKRLQDNFLRFDRLVVQSQSLPKTESLKEFQCYAKSCLYYRIGDYLLLSLKPAPESFHKNQFVTALCAYSMALDHQCGGNETYDIHSPAEAFNMLELEILMAHNSLVADGFSSVNELLRSNKLTSYIISYIFPQKRESIELGFIKADLLKHIKLPELRKIDSQKLLDQIWNVRRHSAFLRRFLWIRSRLAIDDDEFLNNHVTRFAEYPKSLSAVYEAEDFSLFDLKMLIYRMSVQCDLVEIKPKTSEKTFLYPPHFQTLPNKHFMRIWSIVNDLLDTGTYKKNKNASDRISFVSTLEEIRQCVSYEADKRNLAKTTYYLWDKLSHGINLIPEVRQYIMKLFEKYTELVLNSKSEGQPSVLFPSVQDENEKVEDQNIRDNIYYLLAQYAWSLSDRLQATSYVEKISELSRSKENVKLLIEKIQQRNSKNASPDSCGSFQMIEEVKIEVIIDEGHPDDSFKTCNQSTHPFNITSSSQDSTADTIQRIDETQRANETVDISKIREEIEAEIKQDATRKMLSTILDKFVQISAKKTQELKKTR